MIARARQESRRWAAVMRATVMGIALLAAWGGVARGPGSGVALEAADTAAPGWAGPSGPQAALATAAGTSEPAASDRPAQPTPSPAAGEHPAESPSTEPKQLIATTNLWRAMQEGGVLMYPIALCSVVMVAFVLERLVALRRGRVIPKPFITRLLEQIRQGQLERRQALALCQENRSVVAQVCAAAIRKWGRPAVEVEQALLDAGERATYGLRAHLRVFNAVATVAPLLGLLGTVFGMIQAFNAVAASDALGRPELLASGVAQALLTTAFGLSVAIPALLLYYVFVSRADRLITEIDAYGEELVHLISAEAISFGDESRAKLRRVGRRENGTDTGAGGGDEQASAASRNTPQAKAPPAREKRAG